MRRALEHPHLAAVVELTSMNGARSAAFAESRPSNRCGGSTTWSSTLTRIRSSTCMRAPPRPRCDGAVRLVRRSARSEAHGLACRPDGRHGIVRRPPFGSNPLVGERGSDTQRRILDAALEVFDEVGFAEARVELITERAGCSRPAFYQYFSSKDDVFWTLAGQLGQEMVALAKRLEPVTPTRRASPTSPPGSTSSWPSTRPRRRCSPRSRPPAATTSPRPASSSVDQRPHRPGLLRAFGAADGRRPAAGSSPASSPC